MVPSRAARYPLEVDEFTNPSSLSLGQRLSGLIARTGLSDEQFCRVSGVDLDAVRAWKTGATVPTLRDIEDASATLGVRVRDLQRTISTGWPLEGLHFFAAQGAPTLEDLARTGTHRWIGEFRRAVLDLHELNQTLGITAPPLPRLIPPEVETQAPHRADWLAARAREAWGIPPTGPIEMLPVLRSAGIALFVAPDVLVGIQGVAMALPHPALFVSPADSGRLRFVLAHELCHLLVDVDDERVLVSTQEDAGPRPGRPYEDVEARASAFAAHFLAPRASVVALVSGDPTSEESVSSVARTLGLSRTTAINRIVHELIEPERRDICRRSMLARFPGRWIPGIAETVPANGFYAPLVDPVMRALGAGSIDALRAREVLHVGLDECLPDHAAASVSHRAPLRAKEDDARVAAARWLLAHPELNAEAGLPRRVGTHWEFDLPVGRLIVSGALEVRHER